jgi:hypothetical protein
LQTFERQCRLEKNISIYFVTTKQYNDAWNSSGYNQY